MEIRETKKESKSVFEASPFDSDNPNETEKLFSDIADKYSLISKGGICKKELARGPKGGIFVFHKMDVPDSSGLRDQIVRSFKKKGHTVISDTT